MRPIKFRVWDNHKKCWESRLCAITNTGRLIVYNPITGEWFEPQHSGYKVSWFTGSFAAKSYRKGKSGKEIYGGDMCKAGTYSQGAAEKKIYEVQFSQFEWIFYSEKTGDVISFSETSSSYIEIVGYIHSEAKE